MKNKTTNDLILVPIKMFKAKKQTKRFRENQKVWVTKELDNHAIIRFKYRGHGRYVSGIISIFDLRGKANYNTVIGECGFTEIMVQKKFKDRLLTKKTQLKSKHNGRK